MENVQGRCVVGKFTGLLASFLVFLSSYSAHINASETQKTLVLIGGALTTCSSMSSQNCEIKHSSKVKKVTVIT